VRVAQQALARLAMRASAAAARRDRRLARTPSACLAMSSAPLKLSSAVRRPSLGSALTHLPNPAGTSARVLCLEAESAAERDAWVAALRAHGGVQGGVQGGMQGGVQGGRQPQERASE